MSFAAKATFVITSSSTKLPSTLTNKVVLVSITNAVLKTVANGGQIQNTVTFNGKTVPADAVFKLASDLSGAAMAYDVLFYDSATGTLIANVLKASCAPGDSFYLGIGDVTITTYQGGSVGAAYPSGYKLAWYPGNGSSLSLLDSTANAQNGSNSGGTAIAGKIKGAVHFDGSSTIDFGVLPDISSWVIRLWAKTSIATAQYVLGRSNSSATYIPFWMSVNSSSGYTNATSSWKAVTDGALGTGSFHRAAFRFDGNYLSYWVDGVKAFEQYSASPTVTSATLHLILAQCGDFTSGGKFTGDIDGLEIIGGSVSDDEMVADFYSQNDPTASGFFSSITVTTTGYTGNSNATSTAAAVGRSVAASVGSASSTSSATTSTAIDKYVDATLGSDFNSGTLASPYQTIGKACLSIAARGTIYVRAGTYRESVNISQATHARGTSWDDAITLKAYPGETVRWTAPGFGGGLTVLGFSDVATYPTQYAYYWIVDGFIFHGDGNLDQERTLGGCIGALCANFVHIKNCEMQWTINDGIIPGEPGGQNDWIFENCIIHDCGDGEGPGEHGIYWNGKRVLIDGCTVYQNSGVGIHIFSSAHTDSTDDAVVRNCLVYANGYGTHNGNNGGGGGILVANGVRAQVYNCIVYSTFLGPGIVADYYQTDAKIINNTVYGCETPGIKVGPTAVNTLLANNLVYGNSTGNGSGLEIADNGTGTTPDHNFTTNPPFSVDFHVAAGSGAIGYGTDSHSFGIAGLNVDIVDTPRPNGRCTAGAVEYTGETSHGTASATSTVVAVGAAIARAVGTSASTSSASAVPAGAVGTAASTATAVAVGIGKFSAVGSAAATSTMLGLSTGVVYGVGTCHATSTARAGTPATSISQSILDKILKDTAFVAAPMWISLHSGPPGLTGANEISGSTYVRAAAPAASWNPASARLIFNTAAIQFPEMPVSTATWAGIWDSEVDGLFVHGVPLNYPVTIKAGNTPKFEAGQLSVAFSSDFSEFLANSILNYIFRGINFTTAPVYWALHTDTSESFNENAGASGTEVSGGTYARQQAVIANWAAAGENLNGNSLFSLDYQAVVSFSGMPETTVRNLALWNASVAGNFLMWGPAVEVSVVNGQTVAIDGTIARRLSATLTQTP